MSFQQKEKEKDINNSESSSSGSEQSQLNKGQNSQEQDSFIVNDDQQQVQDQYYYPRRRDDSDESGSERKKSKKDRKKMKKLKKHRIKQDQSQLDQGDLDVLQQQQQRGRLNRLKQKKQPKKKKFKDQQQQQLDDFQVDQRSQGMASQSGLQYRPASDSQESRLHEVLGGEQLQDIFEPQDQKRLFREQQDKQIISMDIPERYYYQLRNYAKIHNKSIEDVMKIFESEDRNAQARWIYKKCRFSGDQRVVQQKIKNVLDTLHKDKLQIMYIYYYRRKLYSDVLSRSDLIKIYKLDQEWFTFKEQFNKIKDNLVSVIFSFQEMPRLEDMLQQTVDIERLNYFRDFQAFKLPPSHDLKRKNQKKQIISQINERGVSDWLKRTETFLSPDNLCHNFRNRNSDKKPKNPLSEPKIQLQKLLRSSNPQNDKIKYPLLVPEKRIQTICHYLQMQLFSHPELRQKLKQKYYQHLIISTNPTAKGNQDINLYSVYFPVKRIKQKPIYTLNRQLWILACEAQKNDLITIQLQFQWDPSGSDKNLDSDKVFKQILKYYCDVSVHKQGQVWNLFRKQVILRMLQFHFFPAFFKEIKQEITKQGSQIIINSACSQLKKRLLVTPERNKKLAMVLQDKKLGIVFVDQYGQAHSPLQITLMNDKQLKQFANDQIIKKYIQDFKPQKICVGANSRRAQTLRKAIRQIQHLPFCNLCPYQIPSLVAKQKRIQGSSQQLTVLEAISMARFQINPMVQTLSLWSDNINQNGILSLNLHHFQSFVDQRKLKNALQLIALEVVNLVGIDINDLDQKCNNAGKKALQFVSGFGPRKAFDFYQKIQHSIISNRQQIKQLLSGDLLFRNSSPFFKIDTEFHKSLLDKNQKQKKKEKFHKINLLDSTRIPIEWYSLTESLTLKAIKSGFDMRQRKIYMNYSQETIALVQMFKHPQKVNSIEWVWKRQQNPNFDQKLVRQQITSRFKMPSQSKYDFNNEQLFYSLLRETRHTLKKYMIVTVKIISVSKDNRFLNVVIPENGLFGSIKIHETRADYQPGNHIKAIIGNFPFQQSFNQRSDDKQQQLLKVDMLLNFPHKTQSTSHDHDCFHTCFYEIVKQIHPLIDLDKDRFDLRKQDKPVIQVKQQNISRANKTQFRKISHKKFKNLAVGPAVELIRNSPIGQFVIRPSSDGIQYLNITWNFFSGIIAHIKVKSQQKSSSISSYKIISDKDNRNYQSLDEIIDFYITPINNLVQDVISNRKFMPDPVEKIQQTCRLQMNKQPNLIHYYFGCSPQYPQYFLLVYMYREKKPFKQLIKVRNTGLHFHDQVFSNLKELISWFKNHFKDKQYQSYVKKYSIKK